jgi:hypothetical protein
MGNVFSERIKSILNRRKIFYPIERERYRKGTRCEQSDEEST